MGVPLGFAEYNEIVAELQDAAKVADWAYSNNELTRTAEVSFTECAVLSDGTISKPDFVSVTSAQRVGLREAFSTHVGLRGGTPTTPSGWVTTITTDLGNSAIWEDVTTKETGQMFYNPSGDTNPRWALNLDTFNGEADLIIPADVNLSTLQKRSIYAAAVDHINDRIDASMA